MSLSIVSLLGSATEIVFELGLGDLLVGISHECDYPPEALALPRVSRPRFDALGMSSGEIDAAVRRCMEEFGSVYEVDAGLLARLAPDVVLTQAVCEVCAVPTGSVEAAVASLSRPPRVVSLDAHDLAGIAATLEEVGEAAGQRELGEQAAERMRDRLSAVEAGVDSAPRPRVLMLEWLDPPFAPGHWVPEMVEIAGGTNLIGSAGARSHEVGWSDLEMLDPDVLLVEPCGFGLDEAEGDADRHREPLERVAPRALAAGAAWLLHSAWFSRSGPRVVEGVECLAAILHPSRFAETALEGRARRIDSRTAQSGPRGRIETAGAHTGGE